MSVQQCAARREGGELRDKLKGRLPLSSLIHIFLFDRISVKKNISAQTYQQIITSSIDITVLNLIVKEYIMNESTEQDNRIHHSILNRVGSYGNYQANVIKIFILISLIQSSSFFINTYLFYSPPYTCQAQSDKCTAFVCSLPPAERVQYVPKDQIITLANFNGDRRCESQHDVTAMQQAILLGASVGLFIGVIVSDAIGRRSTMLFSLFFTAFGILLVLVVDNIKIKCVGLVIWGSGAEIAFTLLFPYVTEIVTENQRTNCYVKLNAAFAGGAIANAIVFYIFRNWAVVLSLYYGLLNVVAFILFYYYIESPPIEIISKSKNPQEAYRAYMRIAERNGIVDHQITLQEITQLHKEYHDNQSRKEHAYFFTFFDILRYPSLRIDFIKAGFCFLILMFLLYAPVLLLAQLFTNIFLNGIINGLSQFATIPILFKINPILSRRQGLMGMYALFGIFTLFQYFINPNDCLNCSGPIQSFFTLIFFFLARFFINLCSNFFSTIENQTFPAQIRAICVCGVVGVGRLSTLIVPFIPFLKERWSLSYNLLFGLIAFIGVFSVYLMRQTINTLPPQMIQQLEMEEYMYKKVQDKKQPAN